MIQIFGLLLFIILICLIYLYYQGKISKNIPIIFMLFIILIIPFTYLENNNLNIESYSNYDQIMSSSLDIFYTNEKLKQSELKKIKKIDLIDNPIQTILVQKEIKPYILVINVKYYQPNINILMIDYKNKTNSIYNNFSNEIIFTYITEQDLFNENYDLIKNRIKKVNDLEELEKSIADSPENSYIIVIGNNISMFKNARSTIKNNFIDTYKFSWIRNILTSTGSFIVILSKIKKNQIIEYKNIIEKYTSNNSFLTITQNLVSDPIYINSNGGQEFKQIYTNSIFNPISNSDLINSKINTISPINTKYSLSFTAENNYSFVYLSSRELKDQVVIYSKGPTDEYGPTSTSYLDTQRPQLWSFKPTTKIITSPLIVYIHTYSKPYFYLESDEENGVMVVKVNRFKSGLSQHWEIIKDRSSDIYQIRHLKSGMYLGYSDHDGYLYNNDGSIFLSKSDNYKWNINKISENSIDKNVIEGFEPSVSNSYKSVEVPTDYGSSKDPKYEISKEIDGKKVSVKSEGRTVWEENYATIWSGKWIYSGTVDSYKATQNIEKANFLNIEIDNNGRGKVIDPYLKYTMNVIAAGSNILVGTIPTGLLKDYRAIFKLIPSDLDYKDPTKSFPVKMRYLAEKEVSNLNSPIVTGIATQFNSVGSGASKSGLWYSNSCPNNLNNICNAEYRLIFSNGSISNLSIKSDSPSGLTNPDILFAITNIPTDVSNIFAVLQGRKINTEKWFDVDIPPKELESNIRFIKFSGKTGIFKDNTSIFINKQIINLSLGNPFNLQEYSTKLVGDKPILSQFLEASGINTDSTTGFSEKQRMKLDNSIKNESKKTEEKEIVQKFMYGPWISQQKLTDIKKLNDGRLIYLIYEYPYTKMVSSSGEEKYYEGNISQFDPSKWTNYNSTGGGKYLLKDASVFMYGPWIGTEKKAIIKLLNDGKLIYLIYENPFTKMVSSAGEEKYYRGNISEFNPSNWRNYDNTGGGKYLLKFS